MELPETLPDDFDELLALAARAVEDDKRQTQEDIEAAAGAFRQPGEEPPPTRAEAREFLELFEQFKARCAMRGQDEITSQKTLNHAARCRAVLGGR